MPVRKSPFTNTEKSTLFCSPKVNISLLFTEDLQNGEILGWICIDNGLFWVVIPGVYCGILGPGLWSPSAARSFIKGFSLHAYPAGAYFCMCASSRALLHVGLLSLWDRQPSNAPPLLLSPAGLASRRGPHSKTHLGLCPKTP